MRRATDTLELVSRSVLDSAREAFVALSADGRVRRWNLAAERIFGWSESEAVGQELGQLIVPPELRDAHRRGLARFAATGEGDLVGRCVTMPARRRDGVDLQIELTIIPTEGAGDVVFQALLHDVSALASARHAVRDAHDRFAGAFYGAPTGMALVSLAGELLSVNDALCTLLGRTATELLETDVSSLADEDDVDAARAAFRRLLSGELSTYELERRHVRDDGSTVWARVCASLVREPDAASNYIVAHVQDITDSKQAEEDLRQRAEQLTSLALRDGLTELRNRRGFISAIEREQHRKMRHRSDFRIVVFDLEQFAAVNRAQGFAAGDEILRDVADTLSARCRASDVASRIGGDTFGLLLTAADDDDAHVVAERIRADVERSASVALSYGIASPHAGGDSPESMLLRARMALDAGRVRTPTARGHGGLQAPGAIDRVLELARSQLQMQVSYLTEHTETHQLMRRGAGTDDLGVAIGSAVALDETYCRHMLDGALPHIVADLTGHEASAGLAMTRDLGVRAYVGVPVRLSDGRLYGTLCAVDTVVHPELGPRDATLMQFLAGTVAEHIEADEQQSVERRTQAEVSSIHSLLAAVAARDSYTSEHSHQVVELAERVAIRLGLERAEIATVQQVAVLHDVGKVGIPDAVLQKRGPLTDDEWELMRQHPAVGGRILEAASSLAHLAPAVRAEHERWDGQGYPDGLSGEAIPLASRITLACDAYHAMTSDRPYRAALTPAEAAQELAAGAGTQFDPEVIAALLAHLEAARVSAGPRPVFLPVPGNQANHPDRGGWAPPTDVRCACQRCGSHLIGVRSQANLVGVCGNCGTYDVVEVAGSALPGA